MAKPSPQATDLSAVTFRFNVACTVKCGHGWHLPECAWPDHRLIVVRGGSGHLVQAGRRQELRRGSVVFGLPGENYRVEQNERSRLVMSVLRFEARTPKRRKLVLTDFRPEMCLRPHAFPLLEQLAIRLTNAVAHTPAPADGLSAALLRSLLWLLREDRRSGENHQVPHLAFQDLKPALARAAGKTEPTVAALASLCGLSASTFRRRMRECFALSPKQFLLQARLERAKSLLLETSYTVEAIATELGYSEPAHLSRQFKKHVGMSPAIFRASHQ